MKNSDEILNELFNISPLLAGMEKTNVFQLPVGYFHLLEERLANFAISNSMKEFDVHETNAQKVPEGYFDSLSANILAKIKKLYPETAEEELHNLSPKLLSLKKENVFNVPTGYFDSLSANILASIKNLYAETADEELSEFPLLLSLKNKNVFTVPGEYFENFSESIVSKTDQATAKIIEMKPRSSWLKIAAAAVVTGIIAIGSLSVFNNSSKQDNPKTLIASTTVMPAYIQESFQFKTAQQVDDGIAKLSDDDIIKYLEKNGNVMDNELLLKNTDESSLPSQTDYLIDENTLNSYLDKIDEESKTN